MRYDGLFLIFVLIHGIPQACRELVGIDERIRSEIKSFKNGKNNRSFDNFDIFIDFLCLSVDCTDEMQSWVHTLPKTSASVNPNISYVLHYDWIQLPAFPFQSLSTIQLDTLFADLLESIAPKANHSHIVFFIIDSTYRKYTHIVKSHSYYDFTQIKQWQQKWANVTSTVDSPIPSIWISSHQRFVWIDSHAYEFSIPIRQSEWNGLDLLSSLETDSEIHLIRRVLHFQQAVEKLKQMQLSIHEQQEFKILLEKHDLLLHSISCLVAVNCGREQYTQEKTGYMELFSVIRKGVLQVIIPETEERRIRDVVTIDIYNVNSSTFDMQTFQAEILKYQLPFQEITFMIHKITHDPVIEMAFAMALSTLTVPITQDETITMYSLASKTIHGQLMEKTSTGDRICVLLYSTNSTTLRPLVIDQQAYASAMDGMVLITESKGYENPITSAVAAVFDIIAGMSLRSHRIDSLWQVGENPYSLLHPGPHLSLLQKHAFHRNQILYALKNKTNVQRTLDYLQLNDLNAAAFEAKQLSSWIQPEASELPHNQYNLMISLGIISSTIIICIAMIYFKRWKKIKRIKIN